MISDNEEYLKLLRRIDNDPKISQRDLSSELGVSLGKINYCLRELQKKGLIKVQNFKNNKEKFKYLYLLTPKGIVEKTKITLRFMKIKMREYDELNDEIRIVKNKQKKNKKKNDQ
jgi:EPS-associated MarR family transcriptional regulator